MPERPAAPRLRRLAAASSAALLAGLALAPASPARASDRAREQARKVAELLKGKFQLGDGMEEKANSLGMGGSLKLDEPTQPAGPASEAGDPGDAAGMDPTRLPDPGATMRGMPARRPGAVRTLSKLRRSQKKQARDEDLSEVDRQALGKVAQSQAKMDLGVVKKGGFQILSRKLPVELSYDVERPVDSEYILELQAMVRLPGAAAPVPHRKILKIKAVQIGKTEDGDLEWEYEITDARISRIVAKEDHSGVLEVLDVDQEAKGSLIPMITDAQGHDVLDEGVLNNDRLLEWVRLRLPTRPTKVGYGWRTMVPTDLGSRTERNAGLYLLQRLARFDGEVDVAVVQGRFRAMGAEQGAGRFEKIGQDRALFDLDGGRVLYREFRMEGTYLRKTQKGNIPFQARMKGLLMESRLLRGLTSGADRQDRLNAATAIFGG